MRMKFAGAVLALLAAATGVSAQKQLLLLATVIDPAGAEITAIDPNDVRVTENGANLKVTKVELVDRTPKLQLLIDNGIGMPQESIGDLRKGVQGFLQALPPNIEVTVVTTAPQPRFLERATTDRQKLIDAVNRLSPDSGAGRFVESLAEATQRIERDKQQDARYTIVTVGTGAGDTNVRDRDLQQTQERLAKYRTVVHVILLSNVGRSSGFGYVQGEFGQAVAKQTGGRFENLAVANRLTTLLPELGTELSKTLGAGSKQFRVTVDRPGGTDNLGSVAMGVTGKQLVEVAIDAR